MNSSRRIIIIGNGFDISQGLDSSYTSFIIDYFRTAYKQALLTGKYTDEFIVIDQKYPSGTYSSDEAIIDDCNDLYELLESDKFNRIKTSISYTSKLFQELINLSLSKEKMWIDIEKFYYQKLISVNAIDGNPKRFDLKLKEINEFLNVISAKLKMFLTKILEVYYIENNVSVDTISPYIKGGHHTPAGEFVDGLNRVLFINFNYTNIITRSINDDPPSNINYINIHGQLNNPSNPIIFGYGDDTTEEYSDLENRDNDELLINIKSHSYQQTDNYDTILDFIEDGEYDVSIVGHSCGLSDRTLLKTIFEHKSCVKIKAFHYKKDKAEALKEHFYKGIAISRHFKDKPSKLKKLEPFDPDAKIIQKQ